MVSSPLTTPAKNSSCQGFRRLITISGNKLVVGLQVPEVQQISANYLPREDRLLLRAWLPDQCEAQLLLTRRIVKGLIEGIDKMADRMVTGNVPVTAKEQAVAEFAREQPLNREF